MKNLNERFSRRDAEAQSVPVKISASPRLCEKIKTKDSGIPWIGEIPADWEVKRIKYSGKFTKGKLPETFNSDGIGEAIIGASEMNGNVPKIFTQDSFLPHATVDDVLILWDGANAGLVSCGIPGILSSTVVKYSCDCSRYTPRYVYYLFKYFEDYFRSKVGGTTIPHMNPAFIDACALLLPPAGTQKRIAEFLDKKCTEIDALIALQEKMITELKSYKQSVITEAVTRGVPAKTKEIKISHGATEARSVAGRLFVEGRQSCLPVEILRGRQDCRPSTEHSESYILEREQKTSPDAPSPRASVRENIGNSRGDAEAQSVPVKISASQRPCEKIKTKDSGIPWVSEIPVAWNNQKMISILSMRVVDGPHESPELHDDGIPYISATAIENGKINFNLMRGYISEEYCELCDMRYKPQKYDILVVKLGASAGDVAIVETEKRFNIWVPLAAIRCNEKANPYFAYYAFQSDYLKKQMKQAWTFGTQQTLGVKTIERLRILLPPIEEQNEIVNFLNSKCAEIERLLAHKRQKITTLQNYKKSVIFECVTGKELKY